MSTLPHLTVATIIERDGQFLMVHEHSKGQPVINQPAGHVENNETVMQAAIRETEEETGWQVELTDLLGIYHYHAANDRHYCRIAFIGQAVEQRYEGPTDKSIIGAQWLSIDEIQQLSHRGDLVQRCLDDYLKGRRYPLDICQGYTV